jgi:hypothetical protein
MWAAKELCRGALLKNPDGPGSAFAFEQVGENHHAKSEETDRHKDADKNAHNWGWIVELAGIANGKNAVVGIDFAPIDVLPGENRP